MKKIKIILVALSCLFIAGQTRAEYTSLRERTNNWLKENNNETGGLRSGGGRGTDDIGDDDGSDDVMAPSASIGSALWLAVALGAGYAIVLSGVWKRRKTIG
jgi:hypothetical protein